MYYLYAIYALDGSIIMGCVYAIYRVWRYGDIFLGN